MTHKLVLFSLLASACSQSNNIPCDNSIHADVYGKLLIICASTKYANAINSLVFDNVEFIDSEDHGRELQSDINYDEHAECLNPNEGGNYLDTDSSSSRVLSISTANNQLTSMTQMAYWLPPNTSSAVIKCKAVNNTVLSNDIVSKRVIIGYKNIPNIIQYSVSYHIAEAHTEVVAETLTGYMAPGFTKSLLTTDNVIIHTEDGNYAMGAYTNEQQVGKMGFRGYTATTVSDANKWNMFYIGNNMSANTDITFNMFVVVGNLDQVKNSLTLLKEGL